MQEPPLPSLPDGMWHWLCEEVDVRPEVVAQVKARLARGDRPAHEALAEVLVAWRTVVNADGAVVPLAQLRRKSAS